MAGYTQHALIDRLLLKVRWKCEVFQQPGPDDVVDDRAIEVRTAEHVNARVGNHINCPANSLDDRHVKGAAAKIIDEKLSVLESSGGLLSAFGNRCHRCCHGLLQ